MFRLQPPDEQTEQRIAQTAEQLREACERKGIFITVDDRVGEADVAILIGMAPGSLKNSRKIGTSPPYYRRPANGSRVSYRILEVARWIEEGREDW